MHFLHINERNLAVSVHREFFNIIMRGFVNKTIFPARSMTHSSKERVSYRVPLRLSPNGGVMGIPIGLTDTCATSNNSCFFNQLARFFQWTSLVSLPRNTCNYIECHDASKNELTTIFKTLIDQNAVQYCVIFAIFSFFLNPYGFASCCGMIMTNPFS